MGGRRVSRGAWGESIFWTPFSSLGNGVALIAPLPEEIPFTPEEYVALALGRPGPDEGQHDYVARALGRPDPSTSHPNASF